MTDSNVNYTFSYLPPRQNFVHIQRTYKQHRLANGLKNGNTIKKNPFCNKTNKRFINIFKFSFLIV